MKEYIVSYENRFFEDVIVGELIRCKDCKHALLTYDGDAKYCRFWDDKYDVSTSLYLDGDFYCAGAERKEE